MLENRSNEQEIMDDLDISGPVIAQTLKELNTINKTLGGNQISISSYKKLTEGHDKIVLADLGCGGGDIMVEMVKWTKRMKKQASFIGVDANPHIVSYARTNTSDHPEISYLPINIFSDEFRQMKFDIIHCCLFLHHFSDEELIDLFSRFNKQARVGVIVNDLHRHPFAYWSIRTLTYLFSRSEMVRNDASVSVARGFRRAELLEILNKAGIEKFDLRWKWAFRWRLILKTT